MPVLLKSLALAALCASPVAAQTVFVEQGGDWTPALRDRFYVQDQGARIMPSTWMRALVQTDDTPFLADALARYGYLAMPHREDTDLPVGFTTNGTGDDEAIGMTCAACHTRQIDVNGTGYRIDGGPAIVDFQSFLHDLDEAVLAVLKDDASFAAFADKVLGSGSGEPERNALKADVEIWSNRFHTLVDRALPDPAWAPGRLDAVSMIFNRLAGLDLGKETEDYLIAENIAVADAPTRYPFLWNAAKQDLTQWPGFADNGNALLGLARNLGEVYGVFGDFRPLEKNGIAFNRDYISQNSANWDGLTDLEEWIWDIGAPKWPWEIDYALADEGRTVFEMSTAQGGCIECHGKKTGKFRSISHSTYATPVVAAGTDERECQILTRTVKTGVLEGARIRFLTDPLGAEEPAFNVLATSVIGAIVQHAGSFASNELQTSMLTATEGATSMQNDAFMSQFNDLQGAFPVGDTGAAMLRQTAVTACKYEARVLDGIWAAAPYLHNGSVPTLADLLEKPEDRPVSFEPGPNYDLDKIGMAAQQSTFGQTIETTGCDDNASGNSRCGHTWGTDLGDDAKRALLEYLKSI